MGGVAAATSLFVSSSNSIQIVMWHCYLGFGLVVIMRIYSDDVYEDGYWLQCYNTNNEGVAVAERSPVCKTLKSFPKQWERAAQLPRL